MRDERTENENKKASQMETLDRIILKAEVLEEINSGNPEANSKISSEDDEDLLYTHKSENKSNSIQWNSTLCRRAGR